MIRSSVDEFLEIGFGLEEVVDARLLWLAPCTAEILDDVALEITEVLVNDEVPYLDGTFLVVVG